MTLYRDYINIEDSVSDVKAINNSIRNILFTRIGSVPGKPTFGSNLYKVVFNHLDHITENLIITFTKEALAKWEPRITVTDVTVQMVPELNKLIATIFYEYRDKGLDVNEQLSLNLLQ